MIASMTGYGRGEASSEGITVAVELRSVNSRFLEVTARLPRLLSLRENETKELIRTKIARGKINLLATVERERNTALPLKVNASAAKAYYKLLNQLRKAVKLKESVKLEHLLRFSEVLVQKESENTDEEEWALLQEALDKALDELVHMRESEGGELKKDFEERIATLDQTVDKIENLSREQVPAERTRLRDRIKQLMEREVIDEGRLELELALLADRLDVTEECVRFRSHNKFFLRALENNEPAGRKLNFLVQEMNREANTVGSKSSASEIAHLVVHLKEELEKVREQLQNVE
ncbi:MAG: YicC/YloC family endoribonuclease [Nitrososphaerales archaeon]